MKKRIAPLLRDAASVIGLKKADGSHQSPGLTCRHLFETDSIKESGEYWIDPNRGPVDDAIKVHCNVDNRQSCINVDEADEVKLYKALPTNNNNNNHGLVWLIQQLRFTNFAYAAPKNQIGALQRLSSEASQSITVHCENSKVDSANRSVSLLSWNDRMLNNAAESTFRYSVVTDTCTGDAVGAAELKYETNRPERLPIFDVGVWDVGETKKFGVKVGQVCFS